MRSVKARLIVVGLIFSTTYGGNAWAINSTSHLATSLDAASVEMAAKAIPVTDINIEVIIAYDNQSKRGQVVETGPYHLEFAYKPESAGTHIDFYLQKGNNHAAVPNAKVTAQIQMPDGKQKTLNFTYDAKAKHYTALLSGKVAGQHQVKVTSDINEEKVDGRFSFIR